MQAVDAFEHSHPPTRIIYGAGSIAQLPSLLDELEVSRVFAVCGRTVAGGPQLKLLRDQLGENLVSVFDGVRPHGGNENLEQGAEAAHNCNADVLVSLGGGATIDSAKYMALVLARDAPLEDYLVTRDTYRPQARRSLPPNTITHVAIPTTAGSSSEVMPWAGIRDERTRHKLLFRDPQLIPDMALLDPEIVALTGPELTASSGMTAVARCVEVLYSVDRQPLAEAYALQALRMMCAALPTVIADGGDLAARGDTQMAALMSGVAADNAMVSVVHAVGHAVGGRYALQHGVAHALLLAPVARRYLPTTGDLQLRAAEALGHRPRTREEACEKVVEELRILHASLPLPQRLRDVGVPENELAVIAATALADPMTLFAPSQPGEQEMAALLREVW